MKATLGLLTKTEIKQGVVRTVPPFMEKTIRGTKGLLNTWNNLTEIQRNEFIAWVILAKKEETKQKRLNLMVENLQNGKKAPCCFPGDPLRRESAKKWFKKH